MSRTVLISLVLAAAACSRNIQVVTGTAAPSRSDAITGADQLLKAMHDRYAGTWYRNLTFVQKSSFLRPDGSVNRVETWYEAGVIPGRLRIDLGDPARGSGALYRNDSVYTILAGNVANRHSGRNPLMVLGFDVYGQPASRTFEQLRLERIDLSVLRMDTIYGKRAYVVGAGPGDSTTNQFWIEADRLLFVRLITTDTAGRRVTRDTRFEKYVAHGGGWVAEEVRIYVAGKMVFLEEYANVRVNVALDENLFIPERWSTAQHWYKP